MKTQQKLTTVLARYRRHLAEGRNRRKPTELAVMLKRASGSERADLMAMISRHDAWDEVWGTPGTPGAENRR